MPADPVPDDIQADPVPGTLSIFLKGVVDGKKQLEVFRASL